MAEIWKYVEKNSFYEVSNLGRVRSWKNGRFGVRDKPRLMTPCLRSSKNYLVVTISINKKIKSYSVHRLVAELFVPNPEKKPQVHHKNCIKTDNRACNLEWVTASENMRRMFKDGLHNPPVGERSGSSKLKDKDVNEIRDMYLSGYKQYELSEKFNISQSSISLIVNGKTWNNL